MNFQDFIQSELAAIEAKNLWREPKLHPKEGYINFSSNDYLGLGEKTLADFSDLEQLQAGSTGSRLTTGTHAPHLELENLISDWKETEAALIFSSGYLANLGAISALFSPRDVIFSDELNHSCLLDGIKLSGAKKFFYKHRDLEHLEELIKQHRASYRNAVIITDSIFSMDGDRVDLESICKLKKQYNLAIYIDEAHATGVLGSKGAGLVQELKEQGKIQSNDIDIQMGTFSKAIGVKGGYIAGSQNLINLLINKAKTFMFSTAPSPLTCSLVKQNLEQAIQAKALRDKLQDNIKYFSKLLDDAALDWGGDNTAIFSIRVGDIETTLKTSEELYKQGFIVVPIRPPSAPYPRLRVCLSAKHSKRDLEELVKTKIKITPAIMLKLPA